MRNHQVATDALTSDAQRHDPNAVVWKGDRTSGPAGFDRVWHANWEAWSLCSVSSQKFQ